MGQLTIPGAQELNVQSWGRSFPHWLVGRKWEVQLLGGVFRWRCGYRVLDVQLNLAENNFKIIGSSGGISAGRYQLAFATWE